MRLLLNFVAPALDMLVSKIGRWRADATQATACTQRSGPVFYY